jgi:hypothetical protein
MSAFPLGNKTTKENFMKNFIKWLGIISIALVIAFSFTTCEDDSGGGGGTPGGGGSGGGTFTLTDIPAQYNGKYADLTSIASSSFTAGYALYGGQLKANGIGISRVLISNGRVSLPMYIWKDPVRDLKMERYSGNDKNVSLCIDIYSSQDPNLYTGDVASFYDRVDFSNGSATRSWNEGEGYEK